RHEDDGERTVVPGGAVHLLDLEPAQRPRRLAPGPAGDAGTGERLAPRSAGGGSRAAVAVRAAATAVRGPRAVRAGGRGDEARADVERGRLVLGAGQR